MAIVKLLDLVLVAIVKSLLRNLENDLSFENCQIQQKTVKKWKFI